MYKVLVVEDEPPILRGICNAIKQVNPNFEITSTAYNGQDAVELLKKSSYDLVITDINMPINDGFYILEYITKNCPSTISVILTGYQEFDYAKKAIQYKVYDYLVKPINKQVLEKLLNSIDNHLKTQKRENKREKLISSVHTNTYIDKVNEALGENCYMFLLCAGSFPVTGYDSMTPGSSIWKTYNLESISKNIINENFSWIINGKTPSEQIIILAGNSKTCNTFSKSLFNMVSQQKIPITIVVSEQINNYSQIYPTHNLLRDFMYQNIIFGKSSLLFFKNPKNTKSNNNIFDEQKLNISLNYNSVTKTRTAVSNIIKSFNNKHITQQDLKNNLRKILYLINSSSKDNTINIESSLNEVIVNSFNYDSLLEGMDVLIKNCYNKTAIYSSDKKILVEDIKKYIDNHLSETISNQILSKIFGLVPSYISTIFKSHTDTILSEYIINKRIEKAKKLLLSDTNLLAKDVAKLVGYNDPLYFSKVFKKRTGIYPSKYKNKQY
ncbi:DNA-binding response regulator [Vallitalea longa]|uniref:Stage 0 sporulation protein A homolog n=1 Tax=Vallitalea longa TaxID=2936439 RepID=A0A9W5Y7A9_9FIRM|nr:response regulator [Vallitalea longa]GKX27967.1 DNA-binding response regulator [Vallitalea longa]